MSKQEQLVEYIVQDIVEYTAADLGVEYDQAMNLFYNSAVLGKLLDPETGLYIESSAYVYDLFRDELQYGRIVQFEE